VTATRAANKADVVTRELLDERSQRIMDVIDAAKQLELARHAAIDAKLHAANEVLEHRLRMLNDLRGNVVSKTEYTAHHQALASELSGTIKVFQAELKILNEWKAEQGGKASTAAVLGAYAVAIGSWLVGPLIALAIERIVSP
jgi:hypothetical protein